MARRRAERLLTVPLTQIGTPPSWRGLGIWWIFSNVQLGRVVGGDLLAPQQLAHLDGVVELAAAGVEVEAGGGVLLALPAHADAEVEAAVGEHVDGGGGLGQHDRAPQRGDEDVGAEAQVLGDGTDGGEHGERLEPVAVGVGRLLAARRRHRSSGRRRPRGSRRRPRGRRPRCGRCPAASAARARSRRNCQLPGSSCMKVGIWIETWGSSSWPHCAMTAGHRGRRRMAGALGRTVRRHRQLRSAESSSRKAGTVKNVRRLAVGLGVAALPRGRLGGPPSSADAPWPRWATRSSSATVAATSPPSTSSPAHLTDLPAARRPRPAPSTWPPPPTAPSTASASATSAPRHDGNLAQAAEAGALVTYAADGTATHHPHHRRGRHRRLHHLRRHRRERRRHRLRPPRRPTSPAATPAARPSTTVPIDRAAVRGRLGVPLHRRHRHRRGHPRGHHRPVRDPLLRPRLVRRSARPSPTRRRTASGAPRAPPPVRSPSVPPSTRSPVGYDCDSTTGGPLWCAPVAERPRLRPARPPRSSVNTGRPRHRRPHRDRAR